MESKRTKDVQRAALTESLVEAARNGNEENIRNLLNQGALVNAIWNEESALTAAARWNHLNVVNLLLEKGALVDQTDDDGWSALTRASRWGNHDVVKLLIEKGAVVNQIDKGGGSAMTASAYGGHIDVVDLLLQQAANVDQTDQWGRSALTWAAGEGHVDVVKLLLEKGASVDRKDGSGLSALITAAGEGHHQVIDQLLRKGASVDLQDNWGRTALIWAASVGHQACVCQLLDKGASVHIKNEENCTALEEAKATGQEDIVKIITEFTKDIGKKQLSEKNKSSKNKRKEDSQNSVTPQDTHIEQNISCKSVVEEHSSETKEQLEKTQSKTPKTQNNEKNIGNNKQQQKPKSDSQKHLKQTSCSNKNINTGNKNSNHMQIQDLTKSNEEDNQENNANTQEDNQCMDISVNQIDKLKTSQNINTGNKNTNHMQIQDLTKSNEEDNQENNANTQEDNQCMDISVNQIDKLETSQNPVKEQSKVIFNELLCYLIHVRSSVPKEEIVEIISKFYEESFIVEAYEILCNCLPETLQRNIRKIKEIDIKEMVASMYEWFDIIKSDKLPKFGCLSLSRLPATLIKDVDSVTLYMNQLGIKKEIGDAKQELREFKINFSSEVKELKLQFVSEIASIKDMLIKRGECSSPVPNSKITDFYELCPSRTYSEVTMLSTPNDSRESTLTRDSLSSSGISSSSLHSSSNVSTFSDQSLSNTGSSHSLPSADLKKIPWAKTPAPYFSSNPRSTRSTFYEERMQPIKAAIADLKNKPAYENLPTPSTDEMVDGFTVVRSKKNKQKYKENDRSWIIEQ